MHCGHFNESGADVKAKQTLFLAILWRLCRRFGRFGKTARRPGVAEGAPAPPEGGAVARIRKETARQAKGAADRRMSDAALAYPDRIGLRRDGDAPRYLLSGGKGAFMPAEDPLGASRLIVATDLDGDPTQARIRQAIPIAESELRDLFAERIAWRNACLRDRRGRSVAARRQERFRAIVLDDRGWRDAPAERIAEAMLEGVRSLGLNWSAPAKLFAARVGLLREAGEDLPDMSDGALLETLEDWLLPFLDGVTSARDWKRLDMRGPLRAMLDHGQMRLFEQPVRPGSRRRSGTASPSTIRGSTRGSRCGCGRCSARGRTRRPAAGRCG